MSLQVSVIVLAAGSSKRMGRPKQLLPFGVKPLISHCLDRIIAAGYSDIVVVIPDHLPELRSLLAPLPVRMVVNSASDSEMADSVRLGLSAVAASASGILLALVDQPLVSVETFRDMGREHEKTPGKILIPVCHGRKGHPVIFPRQVIGELRSAASLRDIRTKDPDRVKYLTVRDEGVTLDMDTIEDYRYLTARFSAGTSPAGERAEE